MKKFDLREFQRDVHYWANEKGFWSPARSNPYEKLALIHSEVTEALEIFKKGVDPKMNWHGPDGKPEGLGAELADVIIRTIDLASRYGIDIQEKMIEKHEHNKTRPYLNGSKGFIDEEE